MAPYVTHVSMKNAHNIMGTKETPEWHPGLVVALVRSDCSVGEGPKRWERLLSTETRSHKDKVISYA